MISERLQQLIERLGWSQERLANEIVTSPSTVSRWLSGKMPPSKTSLRRIASATGVNIEWLLTGLGEMKIESNLEFLAEEFIRGVDGTKKDQPEINVHEGVLMTTKVLSSGTGYANALWHNLKSFDAAVEREKEMSEMKGMLEQVLRELADLKKAQATHGVDDKKRDEAINS